MDNCTRREAAKLIGCGVIAAAGLLKLPRAHGQMPTVRLAAASAYGGTLPVFAAIEQGFFAKEGINVETLGFSSGPATIEAIATGQCDLANGYPVTVALGRRRGFNTKVVAVGSVNPKGWYVMVRKDSSIKTVQDLVGKKFGFSAKGGTTNLFGLWAARQGGGGATEVVVGAGAVPNLLSGNVDWIVTFPPASSKLKRSGEVRTIVDFGEVMTGTLPDVWVASDDYTSKQPDLVRKALRGVYAGVRYMKTHREWSYKFIQDRMKLEPEYVEDSFNQQIMNLSDDGTIREEWIQNTLELGKLGGFTDLPPAKDVYTTAFTPVVV